MTEAKRRTRPERARTAVSDADLRSRPVRASLAVVEIFVAGGLVLAGVLPMLWLIKASLSTTQELVRKPLGWWEDGPQWSNFAEAWTQVRIGDYLLNTLWIVFGNVLLTLFVCVTGAYVLSVLRPVWGRIVYAAVLATLFIPGIISLIPLYLTVLDLPLVGGNLIDTYWAVWLPASADAFLLVLIKKYFDGLPRDLFDAARVDGAGPVRTLTAIVVPLSRPILGVTALLAGVAAYKDFLWPLLVLPSWDLQPISVALPRMEQAMSLSVLMASLTIAILIPIGIFLVMQRQFLRSVAFSSGVKG